MKIRCDWGSAERYGFYEDNQDQDDDDDVVSFVLWGKRTFNRK